MDISGCSSNVFSKVDVADYIPIVSTVNNIFVLFRKVKMFLSKKENHVQKSYYTHLKQKSFIKCVVLLVPVLGNILIGLIDIYNFLEYNIRKQSIIKKIQKERLDLEGVDERFKNDKDVVLAAVRENGWELKYAKNFQEDKDVVRAAVKQRGLALEYAKKFQDDRGIVLLAVKQDGLALQYASERLKNDEEIVLLAVKQDKWAFDYIGKKIKNDEGTLKNIKKTLE